MIVHLNLSPELEEELHEAWGKDLERNIMEAVAAEFYRQGKCGTATVRKMLSFEDRPETVAFLCDKEVFPNYNLEDLEQDRATFARMDAKLAQKLQNAEPEKPEI